MPADLADGFGGGRVEHAAVDEEEAEDGSVEAEDGP